jgi:hypothetical protein
VAGRHQWNVDVSQLPATATPELNFAVQLTLGELLRSVG